MGELCCFLGSFFLQKKVQAPAGAERLVLLVFVPFFCFFSIVGRVSVVLVP